jgi:DNA-binding MarR family transcriptional regulator
MLGYNAPHLNQTTLKILALYRSNYQHSFHIRDICQKIEVDIKAVSTQLRRLEEANILKSASKGNLKEYRLNLQNQLTKYYLILAETYTTLSFIDRKFEIKRLLEELTDSEQTTETFDSLLPGVVILFGSFASEREDDRSDIDLLTVFQPYGKGAIGNVESNLTGDRVNNFAADHTSVGSAVRNIGTALGREINVKSMTPRQFMSGLRQASPFERQVVANHIVLQNIDRFCDLLWRFFTTWE